MSYELIFVDGGSVDGTLEFIQSVHATKQILNNICGGISDAMNAGIKVARGQIVAHLHADDYYTNDLVLSRVAEVFALQPELGWLFGRFKNEIDGVLYDPPYPFRRYSKTILLRRNIVPHCATFVRSDVFSRIGLFDARYKLAMDYDMWLRVSEHYTPLQIDDYLGVFRRHAGSSTSRNRLRSFNEDFHTRFRHTPAWIWPEIALRYIYRRLKDL